MWLDGLSLSLDVDREINPVKIETTMGSIYCEMYQHPRIGLPIPEAGQRALAGTWIFKDASLRETRLSRDAARLGARTSHDLYRCNSMYSALWLSRFKSLPVWLGGNSVMCRKSPYQPTRCHKRRRLAFSKS